MAKWVLMVLAVSAALAGCAGMQGRGNAEVGYWVGTAEVDVTPDFAVRLNGYRRRDEPVDRVDKRLYARAVAIGSDARSPLVLVTVDNPAIPGWLTEQIAARLQARVGLPRERFALTCSHTHYGPMLRDAIPLIFSEIPEEDQAAIDRYTQFLAGQIEEAAVIALQSMHEATLHFARTEVGFAANRRTEGGPVDHDVPVLVTKDRQGAVRAVVANYACHCTTITGGDSFRSFHSDWVGWASETVQARYPQATALVTVGCGGDQNPTPRGTAELSQQYGTMLGEAIDTAISQGVQAVRGPVSAEFARIDLPLDELPTRAQWEAKAAEGGAEGHHAKVNLARLDRGEALPTHLRYPVQTWRIGEAAIVFLGGEVTVDYSLRIKRDANEKKLWVTAYANDVCSYVPSERVLAEGGYEGGESMMYYDYPAPFAPGVEDRIVGEVMRQLAATHQSAAVSR